MKNSTGKDGFEFNPKMVQNVAIYKLTVEKLTCKGNLK